MLQKPTYGYVGPCPQRPTTKAVLLEWFDAVSFWKDRTRLISALYALYHLATFGVFVYFLVRYFSLASARRSMSG